MESTVRRIHTKASLELQSRVLEKRKQRRLHVWVGFEVVLTGWICCHQRWIGQTMINKVTKIENV